MIRTAIKYIYRKINERFAVKIQIEEKENVI
jgi:hypothetical protein